MSIPHILTDILNRPLMVTPAKLQVIMSILDRKSEQPLGLDLSDLAHMNSISGGESAPQQRAINTAAREESEDGRLIEVIPVIGSLVSRNAGFSDSSGMRSYRTLQYELNSARRNPEVGGIILDMDGYGGMSAGCSRMSRFIREVAQEKPVWAVIDLNAYSAHYSLASACSRVILTDRSDAGVGSIGCIAIHCDISRWAEKEGLNYTVVTFGAHKADFSPYGALSKEQVAALQKSVDAHGMAFAGLVAEFRDMKLQQVLDTEARCYSGQAAIEIGLADEIATFDEAVVMLADEISRKRLSFPQPLQEVGEMPEALSTKQRMEKLLSAEDGPAALAELGYVTGESAKEAAAKAASESAAAALEVVEICQLGDVGMTTTVAMLKSGTTPAAARDQVQQIRSQTSKQHQVKSTTTMATGDGRHPLVENCAALAGKK